LKTLVLRIYVTLLAVLLVFALVAFGLVKWRMDDERVRWQQAASERMAGWGEFIAAGLPAASRPVNEQADALQALSQQLQLPLALEGPGGERLATSAAFAAREALRPRPERSAWSLALPDGRTLLVARPMRGGPGMRHSGPAPADRVTAEGPRTDAAAAAGQHGPDAHGSGRPPVLAMALGPGWGPGWSPVGGLVAVLSALFVAVALAAWPVARRLTRRLEALQQGVRRFGEGQLSERVPVQGRDEVAELARAFNDAAQRVETLVQSNRSLLANASHELRSPLARLKMAIALRDDLAEPPGRGEVLNDGPPGTQDLAQTRQALAAEARRNIDELDALVDELLLASRLQAHAQTLRRVDLLPLVHDEVRRACIAAADWSAEVHADVLEAWVDGDETLLRRALANLLQNARRYGGSCAAVRVQRATGFASGSAASWLVRVSDEGPGVPAEFRERIFEPFFRVPGRAEHEGATGLGLSLVRQIAQAHGGSVRCDDAPGGGCRFDWLIPQASA
jgi:signal transduction histidine kinase